MRTQPFTAALFIKKWELPKCPSVTNRSNAAHPFDRIFVVQSPSRVQLFGTPWTVARQASLSLIISQSLPKFMSFESTMPSDHLVPCHLCLLVPSVFPSIRGLLPVSWLFTSGSQSIRASASATVLPMNIQSWFPLGITGLISLPSKGLSRVFSTTIWKLSILGCSAFFIIQLSHPYMTTGKTVAFTIWTLLAKGCLCFLICCLGLS